MRLLRIVEKYIQIKQKNVEGRQKNVLIQGNRVLLYLVLSKVRQEYAKYNSELINWAEKENEIYGICDNFVAQIYAAISRDDYNYAYLMMFKSLRRTKELIGSLEDVRKGVLTGAMCETDVQLTLDLKFQ